MSKFDTVPFSEVKPPAWGKSTCYVVRPDYIRLKTSIERHGILSPLVVNSDMTLIDGTARLMIADELKITRLPVVVVDLDPTDAAILHIDINRYRGVVIAKYLSELIQNILLNGKYDPEELRDLLAMSKDEFYILADGSLIKMRKIKQHTYSPAWVPIESDSGENITLQGVTGHKEQVTWN